MIKRSFFGLTKPRLEYEMLPDKLPEPEKISPSENVTLLLSASPEQADSTLSVKEGEKIKTGQPYILNHRHETVSRPKLIILYNEGNRRPHDRRY